MLTSSVPTSCQVLLGFPRWITPAGRWEVHSVDYCLAQCLSLLWGKIIKLYMKRPWQCFGNKREEGKAPGRRSKHRKRVICVWFGTQSQNDGKWWKTDSIQKKKILTVEDQISLSSSLASAQPHCHDLQQTDFQLLLFCITWSHLGQVILLCQVIWLLQV